MDLLLYLRESLRRLYIRYGAADNLASCTLQFKNLRHRGCHILGFCVGHGLYQDGIPPADYPVPNPYCLRILPVHCIPP